MRFSCSVERMPLLDGKLYHNSADCGFSGSPTLTLSGNRALRLVCCRLGVKQPRQFPDEPSLPTPQELEQELLAQLQLT